MVSFKALLQCFLAFGLLLSLPAQASESVCNGQFGVQKQQKRTRLQDTMMGVQPTHQAKMADGFLAGNNGNDSGILFESNELVQWGKGDLLAVHPQELAEQKAKGEKNPMQFFVQYEQAPYNGPNDKGTRGGIYKVTAPEKDGITCSKRAEDYSLHFFPGIIDGRQKYQALQQGGVYCVRTRDGDKYALIKVVSLCDDGVVIDYNYGKDSNVFAVDDKIAKSSSKSAPVDSKKQSGAN